MKNPFEKLAGLNGANLGFLTLRLWLGARAVITGLEKYAGKISVEEPLLDATGQPDASGAMMQVDHKVYGFSHYHGLPETLVTKFNAEPLLPAWALKAFGAALGPALIILGVALLTGLFTRPALFLTGLLYTALTLGLILIGQDQGVASLGVHIALVAFALFRSEDNRFTLTRA